MTKRDRQKRKMTYR